MNIAMLTDRLALGGGPECIRLLAAHLPQHRFTVFAAGGGTLPALESLPNVRTVRKTPSRRELAGFDLIHCHHLRPLATLRAPADVPVVNTIHGVHSRKFEFGSGPVNAVRGMLRRTLERRLFSAAAANVVLTAEDQEWLERHYRLTNLVRIPNGVELDGFPDADPGALQDELQLPPHRRCLMMIARFELLKGHDTLIAAVEAAAEPLRKAGALIVLIGDGQMLEPCRAEVRTARLDDLVIFCGGRAGARRFLPLADALLLPSRREGLPLIALEAGVCGVPVIGAAVPGVASLISDGCDGRLFPAGDAAAFAALLADEKLYASLPALGRVWRKTVAEHYNVTAMAAAHDALYRAVGRGRAEL